MVEIIKHFILFHFKTIIPLITEITPAGAAMGQFVHYSQLITSGRFCMFDYGEKANRVLYGSSTPPNYDLNKIIVPITLYYGNNDWLTAAVVCISYYYRNFLWNDEYYFSLRMLKNWHHNCLI